MGTEKDFRPSEDEEEAEGLLASQEEALRAEERFHDAIIKAKDEWGGNFRQIGELLGIAPSWVYKLYHRRRYARGGSKAYPKGPPKSAQKPYSGPH